MLEPFTCHSPDHFNRRTLLKAAGASGLAWLTPVAHALAREEEASGKPVNNPAKSIIMLWLRGGPSQLETFDPHPGTRIGGETEAISTSAKGIQIAAGMPHTAEVMDDITLIRNVVSKEGDHERATFYVKTGRRPNPAAAHPSIGAIVCHQLPVDGAEIPRHVSILPGQWPARGGYLGDKYDAFKTPDPRRAVPDVKKRVPDDRYERRLADLDVVEQAFSRGRPVDLDKKKTLHLASMEAAQRMMTSEQLKAFDVSSEPQSLRDSFGDSPFGRGCLAAARLVEVGVRCVEVTLGGWDTHVNNHELQNGRVDILDPALAALIKELKERDLFESTVVICGGEFGRTPRINPADGRDHWPHGFSIALAGGPLRRGFVLGETDPEGERLDHPQEDDKSAPGEGRNPTVDDVHATVLHALGIDHRHEEYTPTGQPFKLSDGQPIRAVLA